MRKVAIVGDGVCDLSQATIDEYEISTIPYRIFFGDEVYRIWHNEKNTLSVDEFVAKLAKSTKETFPKTSMPSPGEIAAAFDEALKVADTLIVILLSTGLSGVVQAARTVVNTKYPDKDITIFDSKHTMVGTGIQVLEAAKMAKEGKSKEEILNRLESINPRVRTIFVMNDLDYLYKGGRIGRAKKLMASAFNVIPVVQMKDAVITPVGSFKGSKKLTEGLKVFGKKILEHCETNDVFITHINHQETAQEVYNVMNENNSDGVQIHYSLAGTILGVYAGPKTICISYIGNWDEKWLF